MQVLIVDDCQNSRHLLAKLLLQQYPTCDIVQANGLREVRSFLDRNGILNLIVVCDYDLGGGKTALDVIGMLQEFRVNVRLFVLHSDRQRHDPVLAEVFRAMMSWETNTAFIHKADYPMSKLVGLVHKHI